MRCGNLRAILLLLCISSIHAITIEKTTNPIEWFRNYTSSKLKYHFNSTKYSTNFSNYDIKNITNVLTNPKVGKFGYGILMGYSSGICLKKISKTAAVVVGGLFLAIQSLASRGYLHVNHYRIRQDFETILDVNKDGEVNSHDIKAFLIKMRDFLSNGIPEGGGFTTGFVMGLRA